MDFLLHDYFGPGGTTLVEACRDGYKTFSLAVANIAQLVGKKASILHLGAVEKQAKNGDKYLGELLESSGLMDFVVKRTMHDTKFDNGATIEIAACTINQANSPRKPTVRLDEGDLADPSALNETKGVVSTDIHGNKPSWTMVSTRKFANGNLRKEEDRLEENKTGKFFRWCFKEVSEKCPDSRSGITPVDIYVDLTDLDWMTAPEYEKRRTLQSIQTKNDAVLEGDSHFDRFQVWDGCLKCPIVSTCRGDLKKAEGVRPINDLILTFPNWEREDWIAQKECRGVPMVGRIYRAFSRERNVVDAKYWPEQGLFLSRKSGRILGEVIWGKDWGYDHPDVTIIGQKTLGGCGHHHLWVHDELYLTHKDDEEVLRYMVEIGWIKMDKTGKVKEFDPDDGIKYGRPRIMASGHESPKSRKTYRKAGFLVPKRKTECEDGIREVRKLIHPINCKETHLHIHPRCTRLIKDMERYSRKKDKAGDPTEQPEKGGESAPDHGCDSLRFIVMQAFANARDWVKNLPGPRKAA